MRVERIISEQELQRIFQEALEIFTDDTIYVGTVDSQLMEDGITTLMEVWTERIDRNLKIIRTLSKQKFSPQYRAYFYERGITFYEFQSLFDGEIEEKDFASYPAFEFLQLQTHAQRRRFSRNYEDSLSGYVRLLEASDLKVVNFFFRKLSAVVPYHDMKKHTYISGRAGSGKSELMKLVFYNLHKKGNNSLILIDPHGDLCKEILNLDLKGGQDRIIYIDPYFQKGFTPTFNPFLLSDRSEYNVEINSQQIVKVFQELIKKSSLTNQMEALITPCVATLLRKGNVSLSDLQTFMSDDYNQELVELGKKSPIPSHRDFFKRQFYHQSYRITKASIYTKIQSLLNSNTFYNLITGESTFDLHSAVNEGKIILFNLSKGKMGEEASEAFGRFLIAMIQSMAQQRALTDKHFRKPTFLFIDEFQNYVSPSISMILTEARKFGLHLVLANQTLGDNMDSGIKSNFLNNTEVKIIGRNGISTLKPLAQEIGVKVDDLLAMKKYNFYIKSSDRKAVQFKSSDILIKNSRFLLRNDQLEQLKAHQLANYYKPVRSSDIGLNIKAVQERQEQQEQKPKENPNSKFKPKFKL